VRLVIESSAFDLNKFLKSKASTKFQVHKMHQGLEHLQKKYYDYLNELSPNSRIKK
jgi:hypothetical protein